MNKITENQNVKIIAFTGGPCAGKSTLIAKAVEWLQNRGVEALVMSETATELINSGFSPGKVSMEIFEKYLIQYSLIRECAYVEILENMMTDKPRVLLCDRGILDARAYVDDQVFQKILSELDFDIHSLRERYSAVIHLITAADGAQESYTCENNSARSETASEALVIDRRTQKAWFGHQHLFVVDNSTSFEKKISRALSFLARTIKMPEPLEIERKFVIENFNESFIPKDAVAVDIVQHYLARSDAMWRVRSRTIDGSSSYYLTQKKDTGKVGVRIENEKKISKNEYEILLQEWDPMTKPICKRRYCFAYKGHHLEVDVFSEPLNNLIVLEVELQKIDEPVDFPPKWKIKEVTSDSRFGNRAIAKGLLPDKY